MHGKEPVAEVYPGEQPVGVEVGVPTDTGVSVEEVDTVFVLDVVCVGVVVLEDVPVEVCVGVPEGVADKEAQETVRPATAVIIPPLSV